MGWSFDCIDYGRKNFINRLFSKENLNSDSEMATRTSLGISDKGSHVWELFQVHYKKANRTETKVACTLIRKERGGGWGDKNIGYGHHSGLFDCPKKFLNAIDKDDEIIEWIDACDKYQESQKMRKSLSEGMTVKVFDFVSFGINSTLTKKFVLDRRMGKYWVGTCINEDGQIGYSRYRFLPSHVEAICS